MAVNRLTNLDTFQQTRPLLVCGGAAAERAYFFFASCEAIQACACLPSCRSDSISDGVRRLVPGKVAGFGFGEHVKSTFGFDAEGSIAVCESIIGCHRELKLRSDLGRREDRASIVPPATAAAAATTGQESGLTQGEAA